MWTTSRWGCPSTPLSPPHSPGNPTQSHAPHASRSSCSLWAASQAAYTGPRSHAPPLPLRRFLPFTCPLRLWQPCFPCCPSPSHSRCRPLCVWLGVCPLLVNCVCVPARACVEGSLLTACVCACVCLVVLVTRFWRCLQTPRYAELPATPPFALLGTPLSFVYPLHCWGPPCRSCARFTDPSARPPLARRL